MNDYDHEDAFKAANLCAGKFTKLGDSLKMARDKDTARIILLELQEIYANLFSAFIEGVDYGRKNPVKKD